MYQENQPLVYDKNNHRVTDYLVNYRVTNMTFGDVLREKLDSLGIKPAEAARRSKVTKQNLGRILNNTPHADSGAIPKPSVETVDKIAKGIGWDVNEARLAAGYAPVDSTDILFSQSSGIRISLLHGKEYSDEDRAEFEIGLGAAYEALKARIDARKKRETE